VALLSGCIAIQEPVEVTKEADEAFEKIQKQKSRPKIIVSDKPYVNPSPVIRVVDAHKWLKDKTIKIKGGKNSGAIPFYEVVSQIKSQGINISSELPLHGLTYYGLNITETDALTALDIVTSSVGADFIVEDKGQFVRIIPMQKSYYTMSIGNRDLTNSMSFESSVGQNLLSNSLGGGSQSGGSQSGGDSQSGGSSGSGEDEDKSTLKSNENIWVDLKNELNQMLTVKIPVGNSSGTSGPNPRFQTGSSSGQIFKDVQIGTYTLNPSSGRISVQAPKHVRKKIINYVKDLDRSYSTQITVEGQVVVVSQTDTETKGLDVSSFIEFANDEYGIALSNDVFGGASVSLPTQPGEFFSVAAETASNNLLGVVSKDGLLQVFNAYVQSRNNAKTLERPFVTTTSGVPGQFNISRTVLLENFQSQTNSTESGSTTSSNNALIPIDFGTSLKILPRYNPKKELVRAQVELTQVVQNGTGTIQQVVNGELGARVVTTDYPIQEFVEIKGEIVGKNGSMVILGGRELVSYNNDNGGATGLKDSVVGGVFGKSAQTVTRQKYYLVLFIKATTHAETQARVEGV